MLPRWQIGRCVDDTLPGVSSLKAKAGLGQETEQGMFIGERTDLPLSSPSGSACLIKPSGELKVGE